MFGLNKERQKVQAARGVITPADPEEALKEDIEKNRENFKQLARDMMAYCSKLPNSDRRAGLLKTAEEMGLLANAYGELADEFLTKLNKK